MWWYVDRLTWWVGQLGGGWELCAKCACPVRLELNVWIIASFGKQLDKFCRVD